MSQNNKILCTKQQLSAKQHLKSPTHDKYKQHWGGVVKSALLI